jgi:hypothetical protein
MIITQKSYNFYVNGFRAENQNNIKANNVLDLIKTKINYVKTDLKREYLIRVIYIFFSRFLKSIFYHAPTVCFLIILL